MNKKLLIALTVILVLAFAVPAFAGLTGIGGAKAQAPAGDTGFVCGQGACQQPCQQACGGDPAACVQGSCNKTDCPKAGICGSGAACGTGGCASAAQQGCGGGGCGSGACAAAAQN